MPVVSLRRSVRLDFAPSAAAGVGRVGTVGRQLLAEREAYHRDLLRPYGLDLDVDALTGGGSSYGEMGQALLERAVSPHEPVDLLVLAYAIPDLDPGRATATYLSHRCPGRPTAFALSDQGTAAAFTGLKLIGEYVRTGAARRAVLLVVEQPALPYDAGVPVATPTRPTGVALVLEPVVDSTDPCLQLACVSVTPNASEQPPVSPPDTVTITPDEQRPYTGVWWQLAGLFAPDSAPESVLPLSVLLSDFDPLSRSLCLAEFKALLP